MQSVYNNVFSFNEKKKFQIGPIQVFKLFTDFTYSFLSRWGHLHFCINIILQMMHKKMFGKIFKSRFGPQLVVSIADRDMVAEVLRAEGLAPQRANMESWKEYRDMRGRSTGLISAWDPFKPSFFFPSVHQLLSMCRQAISELLQWVLVVSRHCLDLVF